MRYVVLMHSSPQPWGHPTSEYLAEQRALPQAERDRLQAEFERVMTELDERGELVHAEALGDPSAARLYRWADGGSVATDGPYSEAKEHLAGFFLVDVTPERADEIGRAFSGPGETVEVRPVMWPGGDDD